MRGGRECFGVCGVGRVAWVLHYLALLLPFAISMVSVVDSGVRRPPVYWNSSNPMFHSSNNDHVIDVNLGDSIDIICPHYTDHSTPWEYYIVYMVDKMNYDSCVINDTSQKAKILNCSKPNSTTALMSTLLVRDYQPIPGSPDFAEGQSYYFISTSGGLEKEIDNQYQGACFTQKMRMILRVIPPDNSNPACQYGRAERKRGRYPDAMATWVPHYNSWPATWKHSITVWKNRISVRTVASTRRPATTQAGQQTPPTTTTTTATTTRTTTTSTTTTTSERWKSTGKPEIDDDLRDGAGIPSGNVIHVGDGGGKNEGTITDNAASFSRRQPHLLVLLLLFTVTAAMTR